MHKVSFDSSHYCFRHFQSRIFEFCLTLEKNYSFVPAGSANESNMAVMEVDFPSGFTADLDTLPSLEVSEHVKKVETRNGDSRVIVYFENLSFKEVCPTLDAFRTSKVAKQRPSAVVLYDYYDNCKYHEQVLLSDVKYLRLAVQAFIHLSKNSILLQLVVHVNFIMHQKPRYVIFARVAIAKNHAPYGRPNNGRQNRLSTMTTIQTVPLKKVRPAVCTAPPAFRLQLFYQLPNICSIKSI